MEITCDKCGKVGHTTGNTMDGCPHCGAIYTKVEAAMAKGPLRAKAPAADAPLPKARPTDDKGREATVVDGLYRLVNGTRVIARVERLYGTHGPYVLEGQRFDLLTAATILFDSSTTTTREQGSRISKASNASVIGRTAVGAVVFGAPGAVVGGVTAKRVSTTASVVTQTLNTELTVELQFQDSPTKMIVAVTKLEAYHWLLGQVEQTPATDEQLQEMKEAADVATADAARWAKVDAAMAAIKPASRDGIVVNTLIACLIIGVFAGLVYGAHPVTQFLLGILFAILGGLVSIPLGKLLGNWWHGVTEEAEKKQYEEKRQHWYRHLLQRDAVNARSPRKSST